MIPAHLITNDTEECYIDEIVLSPKSEYTTDLYVGIMLRNIFNSVSLFFIQTIHITSFKLSKFMHTSQH